MPTEPTDATGRPGTCTGPARQLLILLVAVATLGALVTRASPASAFWSSSGATGAATRTGWLAPPVDVTVPATRHSFDVPVAWQAGAGQPRPTGYYVLRNAGSATFPACASGPSALLGETSCLDTVSADGRYVYQVVAVHHGWTARSAVSTAVEVRRPTTVVFCRQPTVSVAGNAISPSVRLCLRTDSGQPATAAGVAVTVQLTSGAGPAVLHGTTTVRTDDTGTAEFADLSVDRAGEDYRLVAGAPGLGAGTSATFSVTAGSPTALSMSSPNRSGTASSSPTVGPIVIRRADRFGNPVALGTTTVRLTSTSPGSRFASTAGGPTVTTATIAAGTSTATVYYGDTLAGTPTLTAAATGLTSAAQTATISAAGPQGLVITTAPLSGAASAVASLGPVTVHLRDVFGNESAAPGGGTVITLSTSSGGGRFAATAGGSAVTSVTVPAGSSTASLYYGDTRSGTATLVVTAAGLGTAQTTAGITPAAPARLVVLSAPVSGVAATTPLLGPVTVQRQDAFGNPVVAPAGGTVVGLSSSSTGTTRFAASSAGPAITAVTIPAGATSASFFYADTRAGTPTLAATAAGLSPATQTATIAPAVTSKLAFAAAPTTGGMSLFATTGPFTVQRRDQFDNPTPASTTTTVALTSSSAGGFFAATLSGTVVTTITIPAGASSASFYYGELATGVRTLTAAGAGLTSAITALTMTVLVVPGAPAAARAATPPSAAASSPDARTGVDDQARPGTTDPTVPPPATASTSGPVPTTADPTPTPTAIPGPAAPATSSDPVTEAAPPPDVEDPGPTAPPLLPPVTPSGAAPSTTDPTEP